MHKVFDLGVLVSLYQTEPEWGQQGELDSGTWAAQGTAMSGAREEETRFYPSWYSPNCWHRLSPSPAVKTKPLAVPDNTPQLNKGPQTQPPFQPQPQTLSLPQYQPLQPQPQQLSLPQQPPPIPTPRWLEASFASSPSVDRPSELAGGLGSTATGGHQGCVSQTGVEGDSPGLGVSVTQAREGGPGLEESAVGRVGSGPSTPEQVSLIQKGRRHSLHHHPSSHFLPRVSHAAADVSSTSSSSCHPCVMAAAAPPRSVTLVTMCLCVTGLSVCHREGIVYAMSETIIFVYRKHSFGFVVSVWLGGSEIYIWTSAVSSGTHGDVINMSVK